MKISKLHIISSSLLFAALLGGCASPGEISRAASAQMIPCTAQEIVISNHTGVGVVYWDATCKGKTYKCSGTQAGNGTRQNVSCKPA